MAEPQSTGLAVQPWRAFRFPTAGGKRALTLAALAVGARVGDHLAVRHPGRKIVEHYVLTESGGGKLTLHGEWVDSVPAPE